MKALRRLGLLIALTLGISVTAAANTLFDNLSGAISGTEAFSSDSSGALAFGTDNQSYQLGNITLLVQGTAAVIPGATLEIFGSTGTAPSTLKGTMNTPSFATNTATPTVFTPVGNITLDPNTEYWARLTVTGDVPLAWAYSYSAPTTNLLNEIKVIDSYGTFYASGPYQMKVEATAISGVPIPATVWLMSSALAGFFGLTRRRAA